MPSADASLLLLELVLCAGTSAGVNASAGLDRRPCGMSVCCAQAASCVDPVPDRLSLHTAMASLRGLGRAAEHALHFWHCF